jgi:hypothetical protein
VVERLWQQKATVILNTKGVKTQGISKIYFSKKLHKKKI